MGVSTRASGGVAGESESRLLSLLRADVPSMRGKSEGARVGMSTAVQKEKWPTGQNVLAKMVCGLGRGRWGERMGDTPPRLPVCPPHH